MVGAAVLLALAGTVHAQTAPGRVSTMLPSGEEATVFTSVPDGFEPNTATDEELLEYGFPSRPDPSNAAAYALWQKAVHTTRIATELVEKPGVYHLPAQELKLNPNATSTSGNWSGIAIEGTNADFTSIVGYWAVPNVASQTSGTPNAYSSTWVGLDGFDSKDLIQDGTESDWVGGKAIYDAWVEVLPASEVVMSSLPVAPGDAIYAATEYRVVSGKAYAYFYMTNFNTNKNASAVIAFPTAYKFTGQSAEWIEERTAIGGSFEHPMPDYGLAFMSDAYAERGSSSTPYYPNSTSTSVGTTYQVSMVDSPTEKTLSIPIEEGPDAIIFEWKAY